MEPQILVRRGARPDADPVRLPLPPALPAGRVGRGRAAGHPGALPRRGSRRDPRLPRRRGRGGRAREDAAVRLVHGPGRARARARGAVRARLAVRGAHWASSPSPAPTSPAASPTCRSSSCATGGRAARVRQRLPPPRRRGRLRVRPLLDPAVPLPRVDVRARRRRCARRPRSDARPGVRPRRARPAAARASTRGARSSSSTPTADAPPLADTLGAAARARRASAGSTSTRSRSTTASHYGVDANWKVAIENYLECYHCAVAHPAFSDVGRRPPRRATSSSPIRASPPTTRRRATAPARASSTSSGRR